MKILYIHGFASAFDPNNEKVKQLSQIGEVIGVNIDYTKSRKEIQQQITQVILQERVDLLVGCSFGGYYAGLMGTLSGLPFVAMNPVTNPKQDMQKFLGKGTTFAGVPYEFTEQTLEDYPVFANGGNGLVLLDLADDVLDTHAIAEQLTPNYQVITFGGGSHRFDHTENALPRIVEFYEHSKFVN